MHGLKLAALYGFYPQQLGLCGIQKQSAKKTIFDYLSGKKVSEQKIRKILKTFKGAFLYYQLIAKCNRIKDPFDQRVVKAYWLGNELLENVSISCLKEMIIKEFSGPGLLSKKMALEKAKSIPFNSKAHHSFHVLVIGSVTGTIKLEGPLLDICRIGWGKVIKIEKEEKTKQRVMVSYQPIKKIKNKFFLTKPVRKIVFRDIFLKEKIKEGDWVTIHWNYIIQKIKKKDLDYLKKYTKMTIAGLNNQVKKFSQKSGLRLSNKK